MKIQQHRIDTNVVVGLLVREFRCSGTDVSAKVLAMYAGNRTPPMEPQWLATGLSQTWTLISLYPNFMSDSYDSQNVVVFASEEEVNSFVQNEIVDEDENPIENVKWKYADGTLPSTDALPEAADESENAEVSYQLIFTDQDGNAVAGVIANVCDEDTCQPRVADDNGIIEFDAAPYPYAIHVVLSVPDGYEFDTSQEFTAPEDGGEMSFIITKK